MESEFHRQLHTNYVPTDREIERIRQDLVLQTKEAERLDKLIQELSTQRDKIRTYIASHRALISTPRRLPRDRIDEIFLACLPTTRDATMSPKEAPLLLWRVCSAWRHIALSTPALWASLHIPFHFVLADERRMPALVEWLARSGACPLSLSLVGDGWDHGWGESNIYLEPEAVASLHELLASHAKRWRRVKLAEFYPGTLSQFVGTPAPKLEDLDIQGDLPLVLLAPGEIQLAKGPALRKVTLHSWNLNALRRDMGWDHLTHLVVYCDASGAQVSDPVHPFALLSQTPRLVSFEFTPHLSPGAPISKSVTLPFLRRLVVKDPYSLHVGMLDDLLQNLHMPELRYLVLPVAMTAVTDTVLVQLSTNSPLITHLHCLIDLFLDSMHIAKGAFLPALTFLELRDAAGKSSAQASTREWSPLPQIVQLFRSLTPTQGCPFPTLAELSVTDCLSQFFAKILREFLGRWVDTGACMSLRRLAIGFLVPGAGGGGLIDLPRARPFMGAAVEACRRIYWVAVNERLAAVNTSFSILVGRNQENTNNISRTLLDGRPKARQENEVRHVDSVPCAACCYKPALSTNVTASSASFSSICFGRSSRRSGFRVTEADGEKITDDTR